MISRRKNDEPAATTKDATVPVEEVDLADSDAVPRDAASAIGGADEDRFDGVRSEVAGADDREVGEATGAGDGEAAEAGDELDRESAEPEASEPEVPEPEVTAPEVTAPEVTAPEVGGDGEEEEEELVLEGSRLRQVLEAIFFSSADPLTVRRLRRLLPEATLPEIKEQLLALEADLVAHGRGHTLVEENGGYRFLTRTELAPFVARLRGTRKKVRLSKAAFETLAVVAYRQPMRRSDLDVIRGVQSGAIVKNLMEWNLVQVVGRDESLGRPLLYGTTEEFLEQFGIPGLDKLPDPEQFSELGFDVAVEVEAPLDEPVNAEEVTEAEELPAEDSEADEVPSEENSTEEIPAEHTEPLVDPLTAADTEFEPESDNDQELSE